MFSEGSSPSSSPVDAAAADPAAMYAAAAAAAGFRGLLGCSAAAAAPPPFPQVQYFAGNGQDKPPTAMAFHSKDNFWDSFRRKSGGYGPILGCNLATCNFPYLSLRISMM